MYRSYLSVFEIRTKIHITKISDIVALMSRCLDSCVCPYIVTSIAGNTFIPVGSTGTTTDAYRHCDKTFIIISVFETMSTIYTYLQPSVVPCTIVISNCSKFLVYLKGRLLLLKRSFFW